VRTAAHILRMPPPRKPIRATDPDEPLPPAFVCDPAQHRIHRINADGQLLDSFGMRGAGPGEFDTPSDSALVLPMFEEEDIASCSRAALIAVADRMNHRVQVFELEGQFVTAIGEFSEAAATAAARPGRHGWPYFRLTPHPVLSEPVRLRWEAPWLHVVDAHGATTRIDLAYAMLPAFDQWLAGATMQTLLSAHHHFRFVVRHAEVMALPLMRLETALGDALLRAGDVEAVTRVWSLSWPAGLSRELAIAEAHQRAHLATAAAFRLGSAHRVTRLRAALRMGMPGTMMTSELHASEAVGTERMCVGE
jgi:hypothetical protein